MSVDIGQVHGLQGVTSGIVFASDHQREQRYFHYTMGCSRERIRSTHSTLHRIDGMKLNIEFTGDYSSNGPTAKQRATNAHRVPFNLRIYFLFRSQYSYHSHQSYRF